MIPEINKTYHYFDDGKINHSRKHGVVITDIVKFDLVDRKTLDEWKSEVKECNWLYNQTTDYFVYGHIVDINQDVVFVRDTNNGWFSLGWWGGSLDIDGKLLELLKLK